MKRVLLLALALMLAGCGLLKKKTTADAGVDAAVTADAGDTTVVDDSDAGSTTDVAPVIPSATPSAPGGIFQGTYKCGGAWSELKVSQQGTTVTASHNEAKIAHVAQCTADGTKCVGTFHATDTKTMKPKSTGVVTLTKTPKGDLSYKAGSGAAMTCKKHS